MNPELVHTPLTVRGKQLDQRLWHQAGEEIKLGCSRCPELQYCGGLGVKAPLFDCMTLCCNHPETCRKYVCPSQRRYSTLVNEVAGFKLNPYRRPVAHMGRLPDYVPFVFDKGNLAGPIHTPIVAVSLYKLINPRDGLAKFSSREELLERFKINPKARVVITATGPDDRVENFWHALRLKMTAESLKRLRPSLIATPNFSMHADTVRHDNLLSMSRIAYCFEAFAGAGLPVALHVNGRTHFDFQRWADYLNASPGICAISYEMGTVGKSSARRSWHAERLTELAKRVDRPLILLLRGGTPHLPELSQVYRRIISVDTSAHMKAKMRQRAVMRGDRLAWTPSPTAPDEPIDRLFVQNIRACRRAIPQTAIDGSLIS